MAIEFPPGSWARPAHHGHGLVLWFPTGNKPVNLVSPLRAAGFKLLASQPYRNGLAVHMVHALPSAALGLLPKPPVSHGSLTAGVLLPW
jgi:hypothetical protein